MVNSTEQSFHSNLTQFRWAQQNGGGAQAQEADAPPGRFARFYNAIGGSYIPLRSTERLGSLLVMFGFSVLIGPLNHLKHIVSKERLPFSIAYLASLGLTLYFALGVRPARVSRETRAHVVALISYVLVYFPGGVTTLRFGGQMALRGAGSLLPI
ncbi:predicted protein [Postia placenta Mad-698-R]|nr:predicted protein [Postia placenta Mad-698-R]